MTFLAVLFHPRNAIAEFIGPRYESNVARNHAYVGHLSLVCKLWLESAVWFERHARLKK